MARLEPIIGTNIVDDIRLGHTWHELETIRMIIVHEQPIWFIEVGVHEGGLSYLLIQGFPELDYLGIELHCDLVRPNVKEVYEKYSKELYCGDCFDPSLLDRIAKLPRKLIYCDGGNKVAELIAYKQVCHPSDLIFVHDYHDGRRKVKEVPPEYLHPEVLPVDVEHMSFGDSFVRFPEYMLNETRIIGWRKLYRQTVP